MSGSYDSYVAAMREAWKGWWVVWPLTQHARVGDVYDIDAVGAVRRAGTLATRNIAFSCDPGGPAAAFTYDSAGTAKIRLKAAGSSADGFSALAAADAGALVTFDRASSVLVILDSVTQQGMTDTRSVAAALVKEYWAGRWEVTTSRTTAA